MATSLQRISLKAEEDKQYAAAVGAQKMLYELLLRRKMDHEAAKANRPGIPGSSLNGLHPEARGETG